MRKTKTIQLDDITITFSQLTREGNRLFGSQMMPIILANCERMLEHSPTLKGRVDRIISSMAVTGCQIPGELGVEAALTPDGMEILIPLLTRDAHPHPLDEVTTSRLLDEKFAELYAVILELIPLPKKGVVGQT